MRTALVLSAGGMFGAYQAGVWKALAPLFQPDLVVGASIGALNGWAIAGGCSPEGLIERWLHLEPLSRYAWRIPRQLSEGLLDSRPVERIIQEMHAGFQPEREYALVLTDTLRLRPRLVRGPEVSWPHLAASAALLGLFSQQRIEDRWYSDGGLLGALPIWAAAELGAQRIVAVNALRVAPNRAVRGLVKSIQAAARFRPPLSPDLEIVRIEAERPLGSVKEALCWTRANAERWIAQGERDARAVNLKRMDAADAQNNGSHS